MGICSPFVTDDTTWDIEFYRDEQGQEPCRRWMERLNRAKRLALETALEHVLAARGTDVVDTEYGKCLKKGLYEFRLRWSAEEVAAKVGVALSEPAPKSDKILLRVFFCTSGRKIILLLNGYDKATDPSSRRQEREIGVARKLLRAHREAERRTAARRGRGGS